jgi:hypothetical protein
LRPGCGRRTTITTEVATVVRVLVSAASKHGSTSEIADRIAAAIRGGLPGDAIVDVFPAGRVGDVTSYDAFVLGSAVYMGRWLGDARELGADRDHCTAAGLAVLQRPDR